MARGNGLLKHIESVHEGKKPYLCLLCNQKFSQKSKLKGHVARIHDGNKPFSCESCGQVFTNKRNMKLHVASSHEGLVKPSFQCPQCPKKFKQNRSLISHSLKHNGLEGLEFTVTIP